MTSQQSKDTPENPAHTITYEMNIHDVLSLTSITELLQKLLDQGEQPCASGQCFILAARSGNFALVKKLLEKKPSGINTQDKDGKSLLSYFAGQPKDLLQLLKMGANPAVSDIQNVLESVILNTKREEISAVIEILNIVKNSRVQIDVINWLHILHTLNEQLISTALLKCVLDLNINTNITDIHDIMKTEILKYNKADYIMPSHLPILKEILTKLSKSGVSFVDNEGVTLLKYCTENIELIITLVKLGAPLQKPYIQYALKTLVSISCTNGDPDDHDQFKLIKPVYIVSKYYTHKDDPDVYGVLQTIVNKGHKLMDIKGTSLIEYCIHIKMLLHLLRLGADCNVPKIYEILHCCAKFCSDHELREILSLVAAAGVKLHVMLYKYGDEDYSFIKYNRSTYIVCHLLQLGASPFHRGESVLKYAFRNSGTANFVKDLKSFIECGFNILDKDKHGCTFLCSAIHICVENTNAQVNIDASCELVRYLLDHPKIRDKNFKLNCEPGYHPQDIIARCHRLHDSRIVDMILTSKFKDTRRVTSIKLTYSDCNPADMSFVSVYLINHDYESYSVKDVDYLYEHGFSANDPGVSPLPAMLYWGKKTTWIQYLLQRGINVEQTLVVLNDSKLQHWKQSLKIPDAFIEAASKGTSMEVMKLLTPHAAFPPLAMLIFRLYRSDMKQKITWFSVLLSLGRVPHGTQAYRAIREKVRDMANIPDNQELLLPVELIDIPDQVGGIKSQELTMFDVAHRSPLSLLELSRYAVKMCLADTAAASNTQSLPQLFKSLLPPGLTDQHIAHKIEQVRNSEVKWLSNEEELLKNPPSILLAGCVSNILDNDI